MHALAKVSSALRSSPACSAAPQPIIGSFVEQRTARDEAAAILSQRLGRFYSRFAPHKLQNVPSAVERYVERQAEMNLILKSLYGADLSWDDRCASASESDMMSIQSRDRELAHSPPVSSTSSLLRASPSKAEQASPAKEASEGIEVMPLLRAHAHAKHHHAPCANAMLAFSDGTPALFAHIQGAAIKGSTPKHVRTIVPLRHVTCQCLGPALQFCRRRHCRPRRRRPLLRRCLRLPTAPQSRRALSISSPSAKARSQSSRCRYIPEHDPRTLGGAVTTDIVQGPAHKNFKFQIKAHTTRTALLSDFRRPDPRPTTCHNLI
jgi:hypothetical protein